MTSVGLLTVEIYVPGITSLKEKRGVVKPLLARLRQIKALESAAGSWKDKDHPELKEGAAKWVKKLRQEYDQRFEKVTRR